LIQRRVGFKIEARVIRGGQHILSLTIPLAHSSGDFRMPV
jgi:hypothetical protein